MNKEEILSIEKCGDLFSNDIDKCKEEYKILSKQWHPDRNIDDTSDVFIKITKLYKRAVNMIKSGTWEKTNYIEIKTNSSKTLAINYLSSFKFEIGMCYVCKENIIYVFDEDKEKYYFNALKRIESIKYSDKKMEKNFSKLMPKVHSTYKTLEGRCCLVLSKPKDVVLLKDVFEYFEGSIDDKHVAWIISRLINIACFLKTNNIVHNGININNCFVSLENHLVYLFGGWWYATKEDEKMFGTTKEIFNVMPISSKQSKKSNSATDIELIKLLGRYLLGEKNSKVPKEVTEFLNSGSSENPFKEFKKWDNSLIKAYKKRKFIKIVIENLYKRRG